MNIVQQSAVDEEEESISHKKINEGKPKRPIRKNTEDDDDCKLFWLWMHDAAKSFTNFATPSKNDEDDVNGSNGQRVLNSYLHIKEDIHTGEKPFRCEECGKAFVQKEIFKRHSMIHTGEKAHQCTFCDKGFVQRDMLKQHINRKHSNNPAFHHVSGLSRHSLVHTGRKFECEFCSKPFSDKSAMKRHVASLHGSILKIET